jgi:hypothetical protein
MNDKIALPDLSSYHARQVRAKYLGGIHLLCECMHVNPNIERLTRDFRESEREDGAGRKGHRRRELMDVSPFLTYARAFT